MQLAVFKLFVFCFPIIFYTINKMSKYKHPLKAVFAKRASAVPISKLSDRWMKRRNNITWHDRAGQKKEYLNILLRCLCFVGHSHFVRRTSCLNYLDILVPVFMWFWYHNTRRRLCKWNIHGNGTSISNFYCVICLWSF